ncbi:hypothetical protein FNO01nite_28150 [Flavobacterium noncentrifugens]|nr:hypothetical protein FNO01nite_28150 [Flavobacterium noncentrifugens]
MKFNLTNESFLPDTMKNFPGATKMQFVDMISASVFYNLIPLFFSFILYYPIVYAINKLIKNNSIVKLVLAGFTLTSTTPLLYLFFNNYKHNDYYMLKAETISWIFVYSISITLYVFLNINLKSLKLKQSNVL